MRYKEVADILERRIRRGDYVTSGVPGEREIAIEQGVSHMTARRAVQKLLCDGVLARKPNGRLDSNTRAAGPGEQGQMQIAFLAPDFDSRMISVWRTALLQAASRHPVSVRTVSYASWDDLVVSETLSSFDGTFFVPLPEMIPPHIDALLRAHASRLVSIELDLTHLGVRSINLFPPIAIRRLLDHLYSLGHRSIDFFNTQPHDKIAVDRAGQWELWRRMHEVEGTLRDHPVPLLQSPLPQAYNVISDMVRSGEMKSTAILCNTEPAALGCIRALRENGYVVGQDISVCAVNDEGLARYLSPTLTALEVTDPTPFLDLCLGWLASENHDWRGPMMLEPLEPPMFIGESTGPARQPKRREPASGSRQTPPDPAHAASHAMNCR